MRRADDYNNRFIQFSTRMERGIIVLLCLAAVLLFAGEIVKGFAPIRNALIETERLEGTSPHP